MQLVLVQARNGLGRRGFHNKLLIALVVHDCHGAIGRNGVQLLRHQEVDIFIVLLQRGKAVGIPTDIKGRAHRIVRGGNLADVGDTLVAPFALGNSLGDLFLYGVIRGAGIGQQGRGKFHAASHGDEEIHQQQGQQNSADFHEPTSTTPPKLLGVVEDWPAFFHEVWRPCGVGGIRP